MTGWLPWTTCWEQTSPGRSGKHVLFSLPRAVWSPAARKISRMSTSVSSLSSVVCSHLCFSWPDDTPLFTDLSFTVGAGGTGLVAPNGAGKTTLLRALLDEIEPDGGEIGVNRVLHLADSRLAEL